MHEAREASPRKPPHPRRIRRVEIWFPVGSELDEILQPRGRRWGYYLRRFLNHHIEGLRAFISREASTGEDRE